MRVHLLLYFDLLVHASLYLLFALALLMLTLDCSLQFSLHINPVMERRAQLELPCQA